MRDDDVRHVQSFRIGGHLIELRQIHGRWEVSVDRGDARTYATAVEAWMSGVQQAESEPQGATR